MYSRISKIFIFVCLFELILYSRVNNFSVMWGQFLDLTSTKYTIKFLFQGEVIKKHLKWNILPKSNCIPLHSIGICYATKN